MLTLVPLTRRQAGDYIRDVHRHHGPPQGFKFAIGCRNGEQLVGVATAGRPVARNLDVVQSSIAHYETGLTAPSAPRLVLWAEALGCDLILVPREASE